jgi:predicted 3-demethylubiquinone-9 3-methyltransferase (glyoxalase superfamily)
VHRKRDRRAVLVRRTIMDLSVISYRVCAPTLEGHPVGSRTDAGARGRTAHYRQPSTFGFAPELLSTAKEASMSKITPFLWYSKEAEEAAAFYASIFPDSRVVRITALPSESPSGPPGTVKVVEFTLFGQPFIAMSAGPLDPFNHAVSFVVNCDDQREVDRYWNALLAGGAAEQCGWLKDRYGLSWQIVPTVLGEMMADPDREKAKRAADAMMKMVKLDIAELKAAFDGKTAAQ